MYRLSIACTLAVLLATSDVALAWKFASLADSRGDNNGVNTTVLRAIVNRINAEGVAFVLFQGDAVTGSSNDDTLRSQMLNWLSIMNGLNCPFYYCPGNHEIASATSEDVLRSLLNQPMNGPPGHLEMVYSFDYQNAHFVSLNSNHYGESHKVQRA